MIDNLLEKFTSIAKGILNCHNIALLSCRGNAFTDLKFISATAPIAISYFSNNYRLCSRLALA